MASQRPVVILGVRHRPFEIATLFAVLFSVLVNVIKGPSAVMAAIDAILPGYMIVWYCGVVLGSIAALVAAFLKVPSCLMWERTGLCLLGMFFLAYGTTSLLVFGLTGLTGANLLFAFSVAALVRVVQLTRDLRALKGEDE